MTRSNAKEHVDTAEQHRSSGELEVAGEHYTLAAYEYLGDAKLVDEVPPARAYNHVAWGLYNLLLAATCFRVAGERDRCANRCRQGILVATDLKARVLERSVPENFYDHARRGVWDEYVGDFRSVGELTERDDAYRAAIDVYEAAGDPETGFSEQEHMRLFEYFEVVSSAVGFPEDEYSRLRSDVSFSTWVRTKQERLPEILTDLEDVGAW